MQVVTIMTADRTGDAMNSSRQFRQQHKLTYPVLVDTNGSAAKAFGLRVFPTNIVVDRQGVIRYFQGGFDGEGLNQTVQQLAAQK